MMRLGKFFRKHLGKYFLNSPQVSIETEQRESIDVSEQSNKDSNPSTQDPLDDPTAVTASQSNKSTAESQTNGRKITYINKRAEEDLLLRSASKSSSESSNSSTIKSVINKQSLLRTGRRSTEEFPLITDTKSQIFNSSKQSKENSKPNQLREDLGISLFPAESVQPFESNTPDPAKSERDNKISLQLEGSGLQSSKNFVAPSDSAIHSTKQDTEPKVDPNLVVTGTTESVHAPFPSTQSNPVSENSREPKRANDAEIPIRITAPECRVKATTLKSKPENVPDSAPKSRQLSESLTNVGQNKDMVSKTQHVPGLPSHKLSELPFNSTSLRNYLESTSVRSSSPRQVTSTSRNPEVANRHSSISASPRPILPRPKPPENTVTAVNSQSASLKPSSSKKNSDILNALQKDVQKDQEECPHKDDEKNEEITEKSPGICPEEEVSLVTLVEVSESTKEVIGSTIKKFGMKEMTTEGYWNVRWSDIGVSIQVCQKLQKYQRINRFPVSGLLMTKNNLAKNTTKMKQTFPEDYDFVPETWCLPGDMSKVEQYARSHDRDCFIVKPNDGSSGKGIIITRNIPKLKLCDKMVCQVYIRKPFLIDGHKFDLRIYTLITSCRPLRLFVYNEGLARFATEQYEEPNQNNESNRYMHLTNYAVNKHSPSYIVGETKGTLRRLTTINKWLVRHSVDAKKVWESMDDAIVKTIISFLPALRHNYRVSFPEQTNSNSCFQILGFDIIFDETLKPYVLEVNDSPSFKADVPLDKEMTESLIHDTFNILHLDENNRSKVLIEEKRQSRMRLLSASIQNRNAIYKEKEQNERLLTQRRIEWENSHMGNYRKVFPNDQKMKHYKKFIRASQDIFSNHS